jgi:Protein of unknown function (DUF3352)
VNGVRSLRVTIGIVAASLSLAAAGCGDQAASTSAGASIAPASTAVLLTVNTDFSAEGWTQAQAQLEKLGGGKALLWDALGGKGGLDLERDVKPALGPETYVVALGLDGADDSTVLLTQPTDPAKLQALAAKGDPPAATREIDGWWAVADSAAALDRFEAARKQGTLAGDGDYRDATKDLPADALATLYLSGAALTQAQGMTGAGAAANEKTVACVLGSDGEVPSSAFAVTSEPGGFRLVGTSGGSPLTGDAAKAAATTLPETLPTGALAFVAAHDLGDVLERASGCAEGESKLALGVLESALGGPLEKTIKPLFDDETALALYPGKTKDADPLVVLATRTDDPSGALNLVSSIAKAAAILGANVSVTTGGGPGIEAKTLEYDGTAITFAAKDDVLYFTTDIAFLEQLDRGGERLADDPAYTDLLAAAGTPDETSGLACVDIPAIAKLAGESGTEAKALDSLGGLVFWSEPDGDRVDVQGFLQIG